MAIFKEAEIKKMLGYVEAGQMSFSRMVELLNQAAYKELAYKGQLVTMMDAVRTLEAFLNHNDKNCKSEMKTIRFPFNSSGILCFVSKSMGFKYIFFSQRYSINE